ncbi:MAG: hypothetical protein ABSH35_18945 [Isosphaeraceae bacterium]
MSMSKRTRDRVRRGVRVPAIDRAETLRQLAENVACTRQLIDRYNAPIALPGFSAALDPAACDQLPGILRPNAERNQWLYEQYVNHPEKTIRAIRSEAKTNGWILSSDQTLRKAVKSHCLSLGVDMPRRKQKRNEPK